MKKIKILAFLVFFMFVLNINAQDFKFGWSVGNVNFYGDTINKEINFDINIFHFKWIINKFSVGINILDIYDIYNMNDNKNKYSILPVKLAYVPFNYNNWLFFSIYSKVGWQLIENKNNNSINHGIYSSIGIQLFIFPEWKFYYSPYISLFSEYDTYKKLKIGLEIDITVIVYMFLKGYQEKKEKEYGMSFDWTK